MAAFVRVAPTVSDRLLICATQAARNVALPVSSPAARVSKALEARPLINRLAVGLARRRGGGGHQWNLCSPPTNSQLVRVQNADIIDITAASQTHPSRQTLSSSLTHLPNPH